MVSCTCNQLSDGTLLDAPNDTDLHELTEAPQQLVEHQSAPPSAAGLSPASAQTTASAKPNADETVSTHAAQPNPNPRRVHFVEEPTWQIFVRMPRGYIILLKVRPSDLAKDLRSMISEKVGLDRLEEQCIPEEFQRLLHNFRRLQDGKTLVENHISDNTTLDLFGRTLGQL
jgi:Ubiquitin family